MYEELCRLASSFLRNERAGHTLDPSALVHEAYVKLHAQADAVCNGRTHFMQLAAEQMRRVLIDHARTRNREKRGGRMGRVPLEDAVTIVSDTGPLNVDELNDALSRLAALSPRQARVVEMRYFGGMSVAETAEALGVSERTVEADWRVSRAWLATELAASMTAGG